MRERESDVPIPNRIQGGLLRPGGLRLRRHIRPGGAAGGQRGPGKQQRKAVFLRCKKHLLVSLSWTTMLRGGVKKYKLVLGGKEPILFIKKNTTF